MRQLRSIISFLLFSFTANAAVHDDFMARRQSLDRNECFKVFEKSLTADETAALEFLYAYMPLPDLADYDGDFWLQNVQLSLRARQEMKWGKKLTDQLWRHFVLPVRVNNEDLDMSREVFYNELKDRIKGMSMTEAALEVNHWCHEKVTYTPSDSRTSSPLATVRSAIGRCGEESTFTVAAMRAVGIPARQVYTPRWAHTDDNHAWVEVWTDGAWHFLGACEPEAVLDLGWFNAPASRAMLMHTKVFGKYEGKEEVMNRSNCFTEIAVTSNYAPVSTAWVKVVDMNGDPVSGAKVLYKLYNYAEFYTIATKYTDETGHSELSAGHGDLLVWAVKDGRFGIAKMSVGKSEEAIVKLDKTENFIGSMSIDVVPPVERNNLPKVTKKQADRNKRRLAEEDSIRNTYTATFKKGNEFLEKARGNHQAISLFLMKHPGQKAEMLLKSLSDKDLRDCKLSVLEDHYINTDSISTESDALYYMSPRISNELLTSFRSAFLKEKELMQFEGNPEALAEWTRKNIQTDNEWNPQSLCMSPWQVYSLRITDSHSRDIFYVAAARTLGIRSRIDGVTGKVQYLEDGQWQDVIFDEIVENRSRKGVLRASYEPMAHIDNPKYYSHFSISRIVEGEPVLLNYPESGCDWASLLKPGEPLDCGSYLVVTGTRQANGSVLAHLEFAPIFAGSTTDIALRMREDKDGVQVIGSFNSENIYNDEQDGRKSLLSTTGRGYYVIGMLAPNHEPTNHALRDIAACKDELEKWGRKIVLLCNSDDAMQRFTNRDDFKALPSTVVWGTDVENKISREMEESMKAGESDYPVFMICDTFNRVVFISKGYTIGLGERLLNVVKKLEAN